MAKGKSMLKLTGFSEFLEDLQEAGGRIEVEGKKCFEECSQNLYDELYSKAKKAKLSQDLLNKMISETDFKDGVWSYSCGWKKFSSPNVTPLPDFYKVLFANYGTPERQTKAGKSTGSVTGKNFIKKAKRSAATKNKKVQQEMIERILGGNE